MTEKTVKAAIGGGRLDVFLSDMLPELTRSAAQKLLQNGGVTKNGAPVKKNYRVEAGDVFLVSLPEPEAAEISAQDIPLDVVYEDDDVIVVNVNQIGCIAQSRFMRGALRLGGEFLRLRLGKCALRIGNARHIPASEMQRDRACQDQQHSRRRNHARHLEDDALVELRLAAVHDRFIAELRTDCIHERQKIRFSHSNSSFSR